MFGLVEMLQESDTFGHSNKHVPVNANEKHTSASDGPMTGIKVVEFCGGVMGPMASCILADQGADVIKVEAEGSPDVTRNAGPVPLACPTYC